MHGFWKARPHPMLVASSTHRTPFIIMKRSVCSFHIFFAQQKKFPAGPGEATENQFTFASGG
jgi:hypothetical protein